MTEQNNPPQNPGAGTDRILRSMTDDGAFRLMAARTTDTVRGVVEAQGLSGEDARSLGRLVTAAILYRETMAPTLRVQLVVQGASGSGYMTADSNPEGWARGLLRRSAESPDGALTLSGGGAMLQMMRSLPNGSLHRGVVEVPEDGDLSRAFQGYMLASEQIATMTSVEVVLDDAGGVAAAGGYLVQILPEASDKENTLKAMSARIEAFVDISARLLETAADPQPLTDAIFEEMPYTPLGDSPLSFGCNCSKERVMASLRTLGPEDLMSLIEGGEALETSCDHCGKAYAVQVPELEAVLATKTRGES